jgi:hypothetical protein
MRISYCPPCVQIIALADPRPSVYSLIQTDPDVTFHCSHTDKDSALKHYFAMRSNGYHCALVWHGMIYRQC